MREGSSEFTSLAKMKGHCGLVHDIGVLSPDNLFPLSTMFKKNKNNTEESFLQLLVLTDDFLSVGDS